jgi:hypothetical protein
MNATARGTVERRVLWLSVGLILFAAMGVLIYGQLAGLTVLPQSSGPIGSGGTARQALAPAAELAAQWQADAGLAIVSGQWSAAGVRPEGDVEWSFQFFSPSTQRLALIVVDNGEARVLREGLSPYVVPTFPAEEWHVDSDQARQTWWDRGGGSMVAQRPDADLLMQLRVPGDEGEHPVWSVAGLVAGADSAFTVVVDASDGALLGP